MSVTDTADNRFRVKISTTATLLTPSVLMVSMASRIVSSEEHDTTGRGTAIEGINVRSES